jgi:hypothetical protein
MIDLWNLASDAISSIRGTAAMFLAAVAMTAAGVPAVIAVGFLEVDLAKRVLSAGDSVAIITP